MLWQQYLLLGLVSCLVERLETQFWPTRYEKVPSSNVKDITNEKLECQDKMLDFREGDPEVPN